MAQMDKAGLEALQRATIAHAEKHGIRQSSMADYVEFDRATADTIMGTQAAHRAVVMSQPPQGRTFDPFTRFSGGMRNSMTRVMAGLINSPNWSRR